MLGLGKFKKSGFDLDGAGGEVSGGGSSYTLPPATESTLGGIKVGSRLSVESDGTLSANDQSYTLPTASADTLGGIKVGSRLSVESDGTLSADAQSFTIPVATDTTIGGVKVDPAQGVNITNGVLSISPYLGCKPNPDNSLTDVNNLEDGCYLDVSTGGVYSHTPYSDFRGFIYCIKGRGRWQIAVHQYNKTEICIRMTTGDSNTTYSSWKSISLSNI